LRNNLLTSLPRNSLKVGVEEGKWNNFLKGILWQEFLWILFYSPTVELHI
jgi:hypothetical protein